MKDTLAVVERLRRTAARIADWRLEAARLRAIIGVAGRNDALLASMGQTAGAIEREIIAVDSILTDIDRKSGAAAGQLAEVGDALRLVLMEITELRGIADAVARPMAAEG